MTILFKPNGTLDIATDPSDLPQQVDKTGFNFTSEALTRCKNLRLDRQGLVVTRDGSSKFNSAAIDTAIWLLVEQSGNRYAFAGDEIYQDEVSIASGLTSAQWSAIRYRAFNDTQQQIFALNGTDRKRVIGTDVYEWGIDAPTTAAEVQTGADTGLTGGYNAKYTYVRKSGTTVLAESNPSSADSASVTLTDESLQVYCEGSTDEQVTHIRLYRTATNGIVYTEDSDGILPTTITGHVYTYSWESDYISGTGYLYTSTDSATNTEYLHDWETDTTTETRDEYMMGMHRWEPMLFDTDTPDGSLSDSIPSDHNRPPTGTYTFGPAYNGTCFIISGNDLYYCKPKQPEYWPTTYFIEVSTPQFTGQLGLFHNGQPYFLTRNEIFYIQGTGHGSFFPLPMKAKTGAQGPFGAISVPGQGIYHTGNDGIYLFSGEDKKVTERTLEPLFRGETVQGMPGVSDMTTAWLHHYQNKVYFGYTSSGNSYPTNVLVFNLETNRTTYYIYNDGSDVEIRCIVTDETNNRLIIGDNTGYVRHLEDTTQTTDSNTGIPFEIQSKEYTLQTRRHFPRYAKYDVDASSATSVTGTILLDGVSHQTHTITGERDTKRRLITTGNGRRCQMKISGTGPTKIYMSEME